MAGGLVLGNSMAGLLHDGDSWGHVDLFVAAPVSPRSIWVDPEQIVQVGMLRHAFATCGAHSAGACLQNFSLPLLLNSKQRLPYFGSTCRLKAFVACLAGSVNLSAAMISPSADQSQVGAFG